MDTVHHTPNTKPAVLYKMPIFLLLFLLMHSGVSTQQVYSSNWKTDGVLIGSGVASLLTAYIIDKSAPPLTIDELKQLSPLVINRFDRAAINYYSRPLAVWSDFLVGISVVSPTVLFAEQDIRASAGIFSLMYLETVFLSVLIPQLIKMSVERYRPYVYNPAAPISERVKMDARRSFFSGHATSAFASATFLSIVYGNTNGSSRGKIYVWTGSLLTASLVSYFRYASGSHFPTDILVGVITGIAIGYIVPALHRTR